MAAFERWLDRLIFISLVVGGAGIILMMLHITIDVVSRNFLSYSLIGTVEIVSYYYMISAVFLPLAFVERKSEHIEVELFIQNMPIRQQNYSYIFGRLTGIVFFSILAYQSWLDAVQYTRIGEQPMGLNLAIWPARWILPASFGLIVLAFVLHIWKAIAHFGTPKPQGDGPPYGRDPEGGEGRVHE